MRDVKRIDEFCEELARIWKKYPDFRFGQFILNAFGELYSQGRDPFYPEDDEMIKFLKEYMNKYIHGEN